MISKDYASFYILFVPFYYITYIYIIHIYCCFNNSFSVECFTMLVYSYSIYRVLLRYLNIPPPLM